MKRFLIVCLACVLSAPVMGCDSSSDGNATPTASATGTGVPSTPTSVQTPTTPPSATATPVPSIVRTVLSNGTTGYSYRPQLAFIDPAGTVWLVSADGSGRTKLLEGCTGIGSAKRGDVLTGGLVWSPDGGRIACWRDDLSVLAASADGTASGMPFKAGECLAGPRWAPGGEHLACDGQGTVVVRDPTGKQRASVENSMLGEWSWSPSGRALLLSAPSAVRLSYRVVDLDGRELARIEDAYAGSSMTLRWTLDGGRIAYPGLAGITVVDLAAGGKPQSFPPPSGSVDLGTGPNVDWVLGEKTLLVHNFSGAVTVDASTGAAGTLAGGQLGALAVSPAGVTVAGTVPEAGGKQAVAQLDLKTGATTVIAGSSFDPPGLGPAPQFVFSGNSARLCWTTAPSNAPEAFCTEGGGSAIKVVPPVLVEPDVLGAGDAAVLWTGFSPDLSRLAYTTPGVDSPSAAQTLRVADPAGATAVDIGPTLGALTYAWRPDGVYRAPVRAN